ncbi:MAG: hypothetical protein ACYCQJ_14960 [Nitrososphaerales archaeon]
MSDSFSPVLATYVRDQESMHALIDRTVDQARYQGKDLYSGLSVFGYDGFTIRELMLTYVDSITPRTPMSGADGMYHETKNKLVFRISDDYRDGKVTSDTVGWIKWMIKNFIGDWFLGNKAILDRIAVAQEYLNKLK